MMLFPVFPDDILCMVVGATTNMTWRFFTVTNLITRPIGIACTVFLGSGIIPFSGWWIALWVFFGLAVLVMFILCWKFQPQIEKFIYRLSHKMEKHEDGIKEEKNAQDIQDKEENLNESEENE